MTYHRTTIRYLLLAIGTVSVALGLVGVFLPILPTTPFLLLASACFIRSSTRMHRWLMQHRIFGPYLYNYMAHKAIRRSTRNGTLVFLWITLVISGLALRQLHIQILLMAVGVGVTIHLMMLRIIPDELFFARSLDHLEETSQ